MNRNTIDAASRIPPSSSARRERGLPTCSMASRRPAFRQETIDATVAYFTYLYENYHHVPAYSAPYRTSIGFQATHLDLDFYERHYRPEALSDRQREHMRNWHPDLPTARGR